MNSLTINARKQQRGITLIEVSIGLIIAAILAAAAFFAFQSNSRRQDVKENANAITEAVADITKNYVRTGKTDGVTVGVLIDAGILKAPLTISGATAKNSYGGAITAASTGGVVTLTWGGVPKTQCIDLVTGLFTAGVPSVKIGAATAALTKDGYTTTTLSTDCKTGTDTKLDLAIAMQ